jgi:hypothetical protein
MATATAGATARAKTKADPCGMTNKGTKATATTTADPYGMTNKRTNNSKAKAREMPGKGEGRVQCGADQI